MRCWWSRSRRARAPRPPPRAGAWPRSPSWPPDAAAPSWPRSRERWACDAWDSCAAEVAAELTISHRTASALMHQGLDLRDRFPAVGALLASGAIAVRVATDGDLARAADRGPRLVGPGGRRYRRGRDPVRHTVREETQRRHRHPHQQTGPRCGAPLPDRGQGVWMCGSASPTTRPGPGRSTGVVKISDAELLDRRAEVLARSVCPDDPRTHGERRTEALGIIAVNGDVLPCRCGKSDCPATGKDPRAEHLVIHVITNDPGDQDRPGDSGPRTTVPTTTVPTTVVPTTVVPTTVLGPTVPGAPAGAVPVRGGDRRRRGDPRTAAGRTTRDGRNDPAGAQPDGPDHGARVPAHHRPGAVRAHPRHHLLLPGLRSPRRVLRSGPYDPLHRAAG